MITRRELLLAAAVTLLAPRASLAQSGKRPRVIGVLMEIKPDPLPLRHLDEFKSGMLELGHAEGRDYNIVLRWAEGDLSRLSALTAELVAAKVDLIIPIGSSAAVAAQKLAGTIPIIIVTQSDPVGYGLAVSLSRPGGNVTGLTSMGAELGPKRLDVLRQIVPDLQRVGFIYHGHGGSDAQALQEFTAATGRLKIALIPAPMRSAEDIAAAFETLKRGRAQAIVVSGSSAMIAQRRSIIDRAAAARLPAIYTQPAFAESGGLIAYAPRYEDLFRRAAGYADKLLKGAKPADLPIQQPNTFEFVINMKTARTLGIRMPEGILLRATRIIE